MSQPEARLSRAIIKALNALPNTHVWKNHGSAFMPAGLPDIVGVSNGVFVGVEVKKPGNTTSAIQDRYIERLSSCGGRVGVAYSVEEALGIVNPS